MKVCFYINTLTGTGGTERLTVMLANRLASQGEEVAVISRQGGTTSFFKLAENVKHYALHEELDINIYKNFFKSLARYNKLIKKIQPDYIIDVCVAMSLETLPLTVFRKTKVISWEHFNANVYFNYYTAFLSKWLASKLAHRVIVLTDQDLLAYKKKFNANRIEAVPNPVTIPINGRSANINAKNALAVGRLNEQKGFTYLLEAWSLVSKKHPDWRLQIVGNGELKDKLIEKRDSLQLQNVVEFIPATTEVDKYFVNSSLYVMSSIFEGLPLVLIEAKSFGLPIVSFDCETGPRLVIKDGVDGKLVEVKNVGLLADGISQLISDDELRNEYSKNAIADSVRFSPEIFYKTWENLLV